MYTQKNFRNGVMVILIVISFVTVIVEGTDLTNVNNREIQIPIIQNPHGTRNQMECPICYELFDKNKMKILSCTHSYCKPCINKWFKTSKRCPLCKQLVYIEPLWRKIATTMRSVLFSILGCGGILFLFWYVMLDLLVSQLYCFGVSYNFLAHILTIVSFIQHSVHLIILACLRQFHHHVMNSPSHLAFLVGHAFTLIAFFHVPWLSDDGEALNLSIAQYHHYHLCSSTFFPVLIVTCFNFCYGLTICFSAMCNY